MASIGEITVDVKTRLTISTETAHTILGLLEMYCQENRLKVVNSKRFTKDGSYEPILDFERIDSEESEGKDNE